MANQALVEQLHADYGEILRGFFARRMSCGSEAGALAQEVFLRILSLPEGSAIRSPVSYMFSVARNLLREHSIREGRGRERVGIDDPVAAEQLAVVPSFGAEVDLQLRGNVLRAALAELRPKCRAAVVLAYWQELSYEEIGQHLGVSANMVKKYLRQALRHCRERMTGME
jgi:RNA polymerase sigma factor (sigma-70 family)